MAEFGEAVSPGQEGVQTAAPELKNPNERLLLLGVLTERIVNVQQSLLEQSLEKNAERLSQSSRDRISQQITELTALMEMVAKIKSGESLVPFELKNSLEDDPGTTSYRLVKEGGKLRALDRGGLTILNLQVVRAREGTSTVDQAYSVGLKGVDPQQIRETSFQPQAQQTIIINTLFAYTDNRTGKPRFKPQAGIALSYNQGDNTKGVPSARVGAVTYQGFTPYISETNVRVLMPQFEQVKSVITSSKAEAPR